MKKRPRDGDILTVSSPPHLRELFGQILPMESEFWGATANSIGSSPVPHDDAPEHSEEQASEPSSLPSAVVLSVSKGMEIVVEDADARRRRARAKVIDEDSTQIKVHYIGFKSKYDEWLPKVSPRILQA